MLIPLTQYCDVDYLFLIIPGSLIVLDNHFLACLYFVSCLLIKIRINLWTTQLSQSLLLVTWIWGYWSSLILTQTLLILSQLWVIILALWYVWFLNIARRIVFVISTICLNFYSISAENDTWWPCSLSACVTVHMCPALVCLASKLNFLIQQDFQWINSLIWF